MGNLSMIGAMTEGIRYEVDESSGLVTLIDIKALGKQRAFDGMASTLSLDAAELQKGNLLK